MGTTDLWKSDNHQLTDLVFGDDDGRDPMVGFMGALSHDPEAATNTFDDKQVLEHVLQSIKYTDRDGAVGHAPEAAVTGDGVGQTPTGPAPHTATQVEIMNNVMHLVAQPDGGKDLVSKGIGDGFGDMASAYVPEISQTLTGRRAESIFLTHSAAPDGLDRLDTTRLLYEVAQDPNGRAGIVLGQTVCTAGLLEAHIAHPELHDGGPGKAIRTISESSGPIQGIVGHANADAALSDALASEKGQNDSLKTKGVLTKGVAGVLIGAGAAALVPQGMAGGVVSATAGGYFGAIAGIAIDRMMEGRQASGAADRAIYASGHELNGYQDSVIKQTQDSAIESIETYGSKLPPESTRNEMRDAVNDGWRASDTVLEDAHNQPAA
ncbi:hypothetical protein [Streptomyces roseolus]|uniref:hypothetical protein n=1 Tax=Streptomyces roseolus TaxID=67358 RepID=UPI0016754ED2|nr:hypothetical protein [Streptomyces roseolus]GGR45625.1 hypothetical protein GCM10010282_43200 [Streptomyces roseolus]